MNNRIRIFIVEDEALIADEIRRTLEGFGYEICSICYDYDAAFQALATSQADLYIFDINLNARKNRDGIALANYLKAISYQPFIFLTAYSDYDTISNATAAQPANYLVKPVNPAMLFAAVQLAIARQNLTPPVMEDQHLILPHFFFVKVGNRTVKLLWKDVYCMETSKNYVLLSSVSQTGHYPIRGTINFVLEKLVPNTLRHQFFRISRTHCLNRAHITEFTREYIVCCGKKFENGGRLSAAQIKGME